MQMSKLNTCATLTKVVNNRRTRQQILSVTYKCLESQYVYCLRCDLSEIARASYSQSQNQIHLR